VPSPRSALRRRPLLALIILILLLVVGYVVRALPDSGHSSPKPTVSSSTGQPLSQLPEQARQTVALIEHNGPFRYSHDGSTYQNLERHLPIEPPGYYHEYTVVTPGSSDRGARRIITGKDGTFYYTADHYHSFVRIDLTG
jgi:ribonuclease T1